MRLKLGFFAFSALNWAIQLSFPCKKIERFSTRRYSCNNSRIFLVFWQYNPENKLFWQKEINDRPISEHSESGPANWHGEKIFSLKSANTKNKFNPKVFSSNGRLPSRLGSQIQNFKLKESVSQVSPYSLTPKSPVGLFPQSNNQGAQFTKKATLDSERVRGSRIFL